MIYGKKILILGGTGSLGLMLIKKYIENNRIFILSRDEHKQVAIKSKYPSVKCKIGDIKDVNSIISAIDMFTPDILINAAAMKHIPVAEENPYESVQVNIIGHHNTTVAIDRANHRISDLIFISTDKSCRPVNVYGMCKSISEKIYQNYANTSTDVNVKLVRYGNILDSAGSVIPLFKKLLDEGTISLPLTHKDMTRFLLSLEQATNLIELAYKNKDAHGNIIIPKIKSLRLVDIAKCLVNFYDKRKTGVILEYIGIRPGEKIHEELINETESLNTIDCEDYFILTNKQQHTNTWSYNSKDNVLNYEKAKEFLRKEKII